MRRSPANGLWLLVCLGAGCGIDEGGSGASLAGVAESDGIDVRGSLAGRDWSANCDYSPGAAGIGDPYFPLSGNGGYDVNRYHLQVSYDPATDELVGEARIVAEATQDLSSFNLDLEGLTVDAIEVERRDATWTRDGGELVITPDRGIRKHSRFATTIRYHGIPEPVPDPLAIGGFIHTPDGALVAGEPQVAAQWFPVNDHPRDAARYTLDITAPADLEVVSVGRLAEKRTRDGWTTWRWRAREPMASYLVTWTAGNYQVDTYRDDGISFVDAIDADLFIPPMAPVTGDEVALSGQADLSYKRITRTLAVPAAGGELSFHVSRDTEPDFDFFFVEAHVVGSDAWTTLPDIDGFAQQSSGFCILPFFHPFTLNYMTPEDDGSCTPTGLTGQWWAASGSSQGWEHWRIDLSAYAGQEVEISLGYASDDIFQLFGVAIDEVAFTTGEGATSFEDGDTGGWQVPGAPPPPTVNDNDWFIGGVDDLPPALGPIIQGTLARQPEILEFEASMFGDYPFRDSGAIVHDAPGVSFALENQTRPTYPGSFFDGQSAGVSLVVHELAHQWFGDRVRVDVWQHIWLNEGFATYAQWLWSEREGTPADEIFDFFHSFPDDDPFWEVVIGDPGPVEMFNFAVYGRGAMTLHLLRRAVGDEAFFRILRRWGSRERRGTTADFIALAERISDQELDELFDTWLFTAGKPALPAPLASGLAAPGDPAARQRAAALVRSLARQARGHAHARSP